MNNISLSTKTFDPKGLLLLSYDADSGDKEISRRVSRTATMDGSCVYDDFGFSWTDTDLNLKLSNLSKEEDDLIVYLMKNYSAINAITAEGAFTVLIESYSFAEGKGNLKLLIVGEI